MPKWLQWVIGIILVIGLACLVVLCIATAKDMTFVEFIKSWFEKAPTKETADSIENAISSIKLGI